MFAYLLKQTESCKRTDISFSFHFFFLRAKKQLAEKETTRRRTRRDEKEKQKLRDYNRLAQQRHRANLSGRKKAEINKQRRIQYAEKQAKAAPSTAATPAPSASNAPDSNLAFPSNGALNKAVCRARGKIKASGIRLAHILRGLIKTKDPEVKKHLEALKTPPPSASKVLKTALKSTSHKRDRKTIIARRNLLASFNGGIQVSPYKSLSKKKLIVEDYFNEVAVPLPDKRGVNKKILDKPVKQIFKTFSNTSNHKLSLRTFFRYKPKSVLSVTKTKFHQALCDVCMNPKMKMAVLNSFLVVKTDVDSISEMTLCPNKTRDCVSRTCQHCGVDDVEEQILLTLSDRLDENVSWNRWETVKSNGSSRVQKIRKNGLLRDLISELFKEIQKLSLHHFIRDWQRQSFKSLRSNLERDQGILIVDFAENMLCKQQDAPQSSHWGYKQVTVHPCVLIYLCECGKEILHYEIFVSDDLRHDAHMSHTILESTIKLILNKRSLSKIFIWSDNCSAQYKSRLPFHLLSQLALPVEIERCFFGPRHGKNMCDSAGGRVKTSATQAIASRQFDIVDAQTMYDYCQRELSYGLNEMCAHRIQNFHLVENVHRDISSEDVKPVKGIRELHSFKIQGKGCLKGKNVSCFCCGCVGGGECANTSFVDSKWKLVPCDLITKLSTCTLNSASSTDPNLNDAFIDSFTDNETDMMSRQQFFASLQTKFSNCSSFEQLILIAKDVLNSLHKYPLQSVPFMTMEECNGERDTEALECLPDGLHHIFPVKTTSDGNCLPRSLSLLVFGSEDHHVEIRCRIAMELVLNSHHYLSLCEEDLNYISLLSDFHSDDIVNTFRQETLDICKDGIFMGMWQVMAAANLLKVRIASYYPQRGQLYNAKFFNRTIVPKQLNSPHCLNLLWCSSRQDMPSEYWVANHIVPLMPVSEAVLIVVE